MSKKETEFDRYDRMKKIERESEFQKRKMAEPSKGGNDKKGGKPKSNNSSFKKNRIKDYDMILDEEHEYV